MKLKKVFLLLTLVSCAALLGGCASGPIQPVPTLKNPANAATVTVFRTNDFFGNTYTLSCDQRDLYTIGKNRYAQFPVDPGYHTISVRYFGGVLPVENHASIKLYFASKTSYHFLVAPKVQGVLLKRIKKEEAQRRFAQSQRI